MSASGDEAALQVTVTDDGSQAELVIPAQYPAQLVSAKLCHAALVDAGIELTDAVLGAVEQMVKQRGGTSVELRRMVAQWEAPQHGSDGQVKRLIEHHEPQPDPDPLAQADQSDSDNYYERSAFVTVKAGDTVAQIIEPTAGTDGRDVRGRTVAAKAGQAANFQFDQTLALDNQGALIAQQDGVLNRTADSACIGDEIIVNDYVDFSTGNIDFTGNMIVNKGVRDRFIIKTGGNVEVHGLIEAATIDCDGNLTARGGFAGREVGTARIGGDLSGKYLDNIQGQIDGDLCIDKEVLNCQFTINGAIKSPHAAIIGGRYVVAGPIEITALGSNAAAATQLVIGIVPKLDGFAEQLKPFVEKFNERSEALVTENETFGDDPDRLTATQKERQMEVMFEMSALDEHRQKASAMYDVIAEKINEQRTVDVQVARMLHAGVVLDICGQPYRVTSDVRGPLQIHLDKNGQPVCTGPDGKCVSLSQFTEPQSNAA